MEASGSASPQPVSLRGRPAPAGAAQRTAPAGLNLILGSVIALVVIRFFTEVVPVLPRFANFIDIPIFIALTATALMRPPLDPKERRDVSVLIACSWVFLLVCAMSTLVNASRVETAPVLVFIYGFLGPFGVFLAVYRLWPVGSALRLSRMIVALGVLQLVVVVLLDIPRLLASGNPDEISGTFGENAYQLVFFLLVVGALLAGIFTFEKKRPVARLVPVLFVLSLGTIFLAQYRALLLTTFFTIILIAVVLGSARLRGVAIGAVTAFAFLVTLNYVADTLPGLRLGGTIEVLTGNPTQIVSKRGHALDHVLELFDDDPNYIMTGTGPGTYASRAFQTFTSAESRSQSNVAGAYVLRFTGGKPYTTDVSDRYIAPRVKEGEVFQGSRALGMPFSDYTSVLAEVGVLGFGAIAIIYLTALIYSGRIALAVRRRPIPNDPLPALALACLAAFFVLLQMALLQSWLEVTRITFPAWILLAVVTKEFHCRYQARLDRPSARLQ
jgi:hypothetical protein